MTPDGDAMKLAETLVFGFRKATSERNLLMGDETELMLAQHALAPLAASIDSTMSQMCERRRKVEVSDPWRFGIMLAFLEQQGEFHEVSPVGEIVDTVVLSRFEVFQRLGFWQDELFTDWADERTKKDRKTWRNWAHAARVFLLSEVGKAYLRQADVSPGKFIERCTMDKAVRAVSRISHGELEEHQLDVLVDDTKSSQVMRHALRATAKEWKAVEEEMKESEKDWVEAGDSKPKAVFDPATRSMRISWMDGGGREEKWVTHVVYTASVPTHVVVEDLQEALECFVERWMEEHCGGK